MTVWDTPWTWPVALTGVGVFDVWLIVRGHPSLSQWAGVHPFFALAGCSGLYLHFNTQRLHLGHLDPFVMLARVLRRRRADPVPVHLAGASH